MTPLDPKRPPIRGERPEPTEVWLVDRSRFARAAPPLSVAICYPGPYSLGMSNLGFQAAWRSFLEDPRVRCERFFVEPGAAGPPASVESGARPEPSPLKTSQLDELDITSPLATP